MKILQKTIKQKFFLKGYGVHSGLESNIILYPAPPNSGVVFLKKSDIPIKAHINNVYKTNFCTGLKNKTETIDTVEHLLSAICGCDIDNLFIYVDANELPILDGSANIFVQEFIKTGIIEQNFERKYFVINKHIRVEEGNKFAEFVPYDGTCYDVSIEFKNSIIGQQNILFDMNKNNYAKEVAIARTFGFIENIEQLWANNMALGASLKNSIVIGTANEIINKEGMLIENEFVRHKLLDVIGDTFLAGKRFIGKFRSHCSGHDLNFKLVEKLIKTI